LKEKICILAKKMSKLSSLILLVNSLTKAERKKFSTSQSLSKCDADYLFLYKLIDKHPLISQEKIKEEYMKARPGSSLNTASNYLLDVLLSVLSQLRTDQDIFYKLFNSLMNVKVLYEKSIYQECFILLEQVQEEAIKYENFSILLIAQKMELDYLLTLDFPGIDEQTLLSKQYKINETLKKIRKINEHASLYELLKYRILHKGTARSSKQKQELNDLVVSEMSIVSSSNFDNFEIQKNHKLFQSNYLINVGDYKSALFSFYELNNIFEQNKHLLSNPPIYYLMTIEGVLESLRSIRNYEGMSYFITQLENIDTSSINFKAQINCVVFLYSLFPFLDTGRFEEAKKLIDSNNEKIYDKMNLLVADKQAQIALYTALVYLGTKEFAKARKVISQIQTIDKVIYSLPFYRTIRLVNLMILYELNELDYIAFEVRSVKREIQNKEKMYRIELLMLKLFNMTLHNISNKGRSILWSKIEPELKEFHNNKFELQLLRIFDFTAWIESKILNKPLEKVIKEKHTPIVS
jgi:hypothetical protein